MKNFFGEEKQKLKQNGIIPVICLKNQNELDTLINGLMPTNIRFIEILLRHPFGLDAIKYFKKNFPEFKIGAGTVVTKELLQKAFDSGADFCVSPGTDYSLLDEAQKINLPFLAGCCTPSEIQIANTYGIKTVKFFPAKCSGGIRALKLYESAFAETDFIPTGGITKENLKLYSECKNVTACGGSFMIPKDALLSGNSEEITKSINECVKIHREITL